MPTLAWIWRGQVARFAAGTYGNYIASFWQRTWPINARTTEVPGLRFGRMVGDSEKGPLGEPNSGILRASLAQNRGGTPLKSAKERP